MRTTWGVVRALACASILIATACGDNITAGGELVVGPPGGIPSALRTNEAGGTATFTITLSNPPLQPITIDLSSTNELEGTVEPARITLSRDNFEAGVMVTVTGVDDFVADGSQLYSIRVAPTADLDAADVAVVNDDDDMVGVRVTPTSGLVTTKQGGTATFTVELTSKPAGAVTVPLSSSNTNQGTIDRASVSFTDADWNASQTVTITGKNDGLFNGNVMYTIVTGATTSADAAYTDVVVDDVFVTNLGAALLELELTPVNPTVALGTTQQFTATGVFDDTTTLDVTQAVTWGSATPAVATVSNATGTQGRASTHAIGTSSISAALGAVTGQTTLTVSPATLVSIQVTPPDPTIAKGTTQQFTATGVYSNSSTQDLTSQVLWSSSVLAVATISNATGTQGRALALDAGTTTVRATLGAISGTTTLTVTAAALVSIDVTPVNPTIAKGSTQQFQATGLYSDGSTQPLTASATWGSSATGIATVSNAPGTKGLAAGVAPGTSTISATFDGITGSSLLTVTAATLASIQVTPTNSSTTVGATVPFAATGVFTDGSTQDVTTQVTWASTTSVATISNVTGSQGVATAQGVGQTTITATLGAIVGQTTLTVTAATLVSFTISPTNASIAKGTTQQYTATGLFSDNTTQDITTQVTWGSSLGAVATISNAAGTQGRASAVAVGTTVISATRGTTTVTTNLTVTAAVLQLLQITPTNPSIAKGTNQQFTATAVFSDGSTQNVTSSTTWSSSNTTVATIGNAPGNRGRANGQNEGTTTITGLFSGITGTTLLTVTAATLSSIQVTPTNPTAAKGTTLQFTATGTYSDGTTQNLTAVATWASTTQAVATVSNAAGSQGLASALNTGTSTISASFSGRTGSTLLTVSTAALASIQVTPTNASAAKGTTLAFVATGIFTDGTTQDVTTQVTWGSSAQNVATISNVAGTEGIASAVETGTTTISATSGVIVGSTTLTVTAATLVSIQVTPANPSIADGTSLSFFATGIYSDNSTQDLTTQATWSSTNVAAATVSNAGGSQGLATAVDPGTTQIRATFGATLGVTTLTVSAATLSSIQVTPANPSIADGTSLQFTATGVYTDNTTQDLTTQVSWSSSTAIATISNAVGTQGRASAVDPGSTTITAILGAISGSTILTVTPATLLSIQVTPANDSIADGSTLQFTAIGTYTDASTQDLTAQATWSSTNGTTAQISNAAGSKGLATAQNPGTTTIGATFGGVTGTTQLTVTPATLASIQVTPTNASIADGTTLQYAATGVFTDGSTQDLTATATWSSTTTAAAISNAAGSRGLATAQEAGTTTISATSGTTTGSTTLTVTAATLASVQVTPTDFSIAKGTTLQYTATGLYTDGSVQDITTLATWSSTNSLVATISNASGSQGLASSVNPGTTTITAIFSGASGSTSLTVTAATLVSIDVTPKTPSIANGTTQQFTATGLYTDSSTQDLTDQATWGSTLTSVATISNTPGSHGRATAAGNGTTTISATFGGQTGTTTLTVTGIVLTSVVVTPGNPTAAKGATVQFTCTGIYSDNSTQDLTATALWATTNSAVATVSNASGTQGNATAVEIGSASISCTTGGFTDSSLLTVTAAAITSITVAPANPAIAAGVQLQFTATVLYSDGLVQDITEDAVWTSSNTSAATISNQAGFEGFATTANAGTTTITASFGGSSGTTLLTVTNATVTSIAITPVNTTIAKNTLIQFVALGTFSDGSTQDITTVATWQSSNTTVASISNASGTQGIATGGNSAGTTTITAIYQGITATTTLTVTNATLQSITVTPANPTMADGTSLQLVATGTFSDGSTQNLTLQVNWKSMNQQIVKVGQGRRKRGVAVALNPGSSIVTASTLGISGTTTIMVVP
ncbi:MAG: Ig-like domain-containing protein [Myxococcota bacterium]|nr:Ig-like domain-containing protein [Myxococcota bacterium]